MILRIGIVGTNFAVMLGLAWLLGLEVFGQLIVVWGLAMIAASVLSFGAPLMLLRALSDGGPITVRAILCNVLVYPVGLAVFGLVIMTTVLPALPWFAICGAAIGIHLVTCLSSVMRSLGSVSMSMALRDAGPVIALGLAAVCVPNDGNAIIGVTAVILGVVACLATLWCWRRPNSRALIRKEGQDEPVPLSLWGTSVLGMVLAQVDIVVGGAFLSDEQIGLYGLLRRLTNLVALPLSVATWVTSVPIAKAFGAGNQAALMVASKRASRIALLPGMVLLGCALCILVVLQLPVFRPWGAQGNVVCLILLTGALTQLWFAATFTLATLTNLALFAALARLASVTTYLGMLALIPVISPTSNAVAYVVSILVGSLVLWGVVRQRMGIDTSALSIMTRGQGPTWKHS